MRQDLFTDIWMQSNYFTRTGYFQRALRADVRGYLLKDSLVGRSFCFVYFNQGMRITGCTPDMSNAETYGGR
jgi:hypothetical protein